MLTSLAFIFLAGLAMAEICQRIKLPRIIGMLTTGIPAVVIPRMVQLMDMKYGTDKSIPQLIMAAPPAMIFLLLCCFPHL